MFPVSEAIFQQEKDWIFGVTAAIKQQRRLTNLTNLTMVLVRLNKILRSPIEQFWTFFLS